MAPQRPMTPRAASALLAALLSFTAEAALRGAGDDAKEVSGSYIIEALIQGDHCSVLKAEWGQMNRVAQHQVVAEEDWQWHESGLNGDGHSHDRLLRLFGPDMKSVWQHLRVVCPQGLNSTSVSQKSVRVETMRMKGAHEVRKLVDSGDPKNRIDVVFMGDGYTAAERDRFFEDIQFLVDDMFSGTTFRSYLPVFNIWAVHVPSEESGIGMHGQPKKTPFELFRMGTELRGIYPGNPQAARDACQLAEDCDFPALIANDEYYGGLGGEFVIGTRSRTSGTIVLRHEMGHNFAEVGEEYDDGSVYYGSNSDRDLDLKWAHWLTEPNEPVVKQRSVKRLGEYPWQDLAQGPQTFHFVSDGTYSRWKMVFTVSGCAEEGSLRVFLDGVELDWTPNTPPGAEQPDGTTLDRQFYTYSSMDSGLGAGNHTLTFQSGFRPDESRPIRQLCSLSLLEYGSEEEFKMETGYVGAYPTWDRWGRESYRPTSDSCLMRNMTSHEFCPVCREIMWRNFLSRMSLIDDVKVQASTNGTTRVVLHAVPLAQLRAQPLPKLTESYAVRWKRNGKPQRQLNDVFSFTLPSQDATGSWVVTLAFHTSEVRSDPDGFLTSKQKFKV